MAREYREAKTELVALQAKAEGMGGYLVRVGEVLRSEHSFADSYTTGGTLIDLPTRDSLLDLSEQINAASQKKEHLARLLKDAGFPLAD